jgi:hypothetical protein
MATTDVEARLAALEDRLAIFELEGRYARYFDSRDGDAWAGLFTADGIYQARGATPEGGGIHVQGHVDLARFCREARFDGLHLLHLPQLDVGGDTATGRVHLEFLGLFHGAAAPTVRMAGYYDVAYARVDGRWLMRRRVTTTFARQDASTIGYPPDSAIEAGEPSALEG